MGYVLKRGSKWYAVIWDKVAKKKQFKPLPDSIKKKSEALANMLLLQDAADRRRFGLPVNKKAESSKRFLAFAEDILEEIEMRNGPDWFTACQDFVSAFARHLGKDITFAEITHQRCRQYLSDRQKENGKPLRVVDDDGNEKEKIIRASDSTLRKEVAFLSRVMARAIKDGIISENPFNEIPRPQEPTPQPRFLGIEEFHALLEATPDEERRFRYTLLAYGGMRESEALAIKWRDVDLLNREIRIKNASKGKRPRYPYRNIPIPSPLFTELKKRNGKADDPVLKIQDNWWRDLQSDVKRAKISGHVRIHDLRHTYASWLAQSGKVDLLKIRDLLGHKDLKSTQVYAHLIPGQHKSAAQALDDLGSNRGATEIQAQEKQVC